MYQRLILTDEQSGLQTRIAATVNGSLCAQMTAECVSGTGSRRFALMAIALDTFPARFFACCRPAVPKINHSGKGKEEQLTHFFS